MAREINEDQIKEDLEFMALKLREASERIIEVYKTMDEIYGLIEIKKK